MSLLRRAAWALFPGASREIQTYRRYRATARECAVDEEEHDRMFADFVSRSEGRRALQIGARWKKYAPHFVSIDKYDTAPCIDFQYDVHAMPFEGGSFDAIACNAVLEHVEHPEHAIAELRRVLRPGGEIWVEVPREQPYHPSPGDFWRVTHAGLRIWMRDFEEVSLGVVCMRRSPIDNFVFFHGRKPA